MFFVNVKTKAGPRGFGNLEKAIYFQGAGEHW